MRMEIPGFIGNRIMHAMNREAISLVQKGVCTAEEIDEAVLASFGPRFANLGIIEYLDFSRSRPAGRHRRRRSPAASRR